VNFIRGETARAVSADSPFFEGEAKAVRRGSLVLMFKSDQGQPGRPQRPESVTV